MTIKNNINYLIKKTCNRSSCEGSESLILNGTLEHVLPSNNEPVDVQVTDSILAKNLYKYIDKLPQQHKDILNFITFFFHKRVGINEIFHSLLLCKPPDITD